MKNYLFNKLFWIELSVFFICLMVFYFTKMRDNNISSEFFINLVFLSMLITLLVFRNSNIRHMYFAFILLIVSSIGDILGFNDFTFVTTSLTVSFFILGVVNMILFRNKN